MCIPEKNGEKSVHNIQMIMVLYKILYTVLYKIVLDMVIIPSISHPGIYTYSRQFNMKHNIFGCI